MKFLYESWSASGRFFSEQKSIKKWQATCITPLRPNTFAAFPPWRIQRELVVQDLPMQKYYPFAIQTSIYL